MLICPVRNCRMKLARGERQMECERGHSFDIARSGYVNLLQPQDKRAREPGDTAAAVQARRRLHDRGVTEPLLQAIAEVLSLSEDDCLLDAGCGEGFYGGSLAQRAGLQVSGIDLSTAAIEAAARRYPRSEWIVANADRLVPYAESSFSAILSITGRMNCPEFRRVLKPAGLLLVAVAAPDDLIELRGRGRDRVERTIETFRSDFELAGRAEARAQADLDESGISDVLLSIYRPLQKRVVPATRVTFSFDLLLFRPREAYLTNIWIG